MNKMWKHPNGWTYDEFEIKERAARDGVSFEEWISMNNMEELTFEIEPISTDVEDIDTDLDVIKPIYSEGDIKDFDFRSFKTTGHYGKYTTPKRTGLDKTELVDELREMFPRKTGFHFSVGESKDELIITAPNNEKLKGTGLSEMAVMNFINKNSLNGVDLHELRDNQEYITNELYKNVLEKSIEVVNRENPAGLQISDEETKPFGTIVNTYGQHKDKIKNELYKDLGINRNTYDNITLASLDQLFDDVWWGMEVAEDSESTIFWSAKIGKMIDQMGENRFTMHMNGLDSNLRKRLIKPGTDAHSLMLANQEFIRLGSELDNFTGDKSSKDYIELENRFEIAKKRFNNLHGIYTKDGGEGKLMFDYKGDLIDQTGLTKREIKAMEDSDDFTSGNEKADMLEDKYLKSFVNFFGKGTNHIDAVYPDYNIFLQKEDHFRQVTSKPNITIRFNLGTKEWKNRNIYGGWYGGEAGEGHSALADLGGHNFVGWENAFIGGYDRGGNKITPPTISWKGKDGKEYILNELVDTHFGRTRQNTGKGASWQSVDMATIFLVDNGNDSAKFKELVDKGVLVKKEDSRNKDKDVYVLGWVDGFKATGNSLSSLRRMGLDQSEMIYMDARPLYDMGDEGYIESIDGKVENRYTEDMRYYDGRKLGKGKMSLYIDEDGNIKGTGSPEFLHLANQLDGARVENRDLAIEAHVWKNLLFLNIDKAQMQRGDKTDAFQKGVAQNMPRHLAGALPSALGAIWGSGTSQTIEGGKMRWGGDVPTTISNTAGIYNHIDNTAKSLFQDDPETEGHDYQIMQFGLSDAVKENLKETTGEKFWYGMGSFTPMVMEFAIINSYVNRALGVGWGGASLAGRVQAKLGMGTTGFTSISTRLARASQTKYMAIAGSQGAFKGGRWTANAISKSDLTIMARAKGMTLKQFLKTTKVGKTLQVTQGSKLSRAGALFTNALLEEGKMQLMDPLFGVDMGHGTGFGFYLGGAAARWMTPFRFTQAGLGITKGRHAGKQLEIFKKPGGGYWKTPGDLSPAFNAVLEKNILAGFGGATASQVATPFNALIEDMRGNKAFTTFLDEHYMHFDKEGNKSISWKEWGGEYLLEVMQFGMLGITHHKGILDSPKAYLTLSGKTKKMLEWRDLGNKQVEFKEGGKRRKIKDANGRKPGEEGYIETLAEKRIDKEKTNWDEYYKYHELANVAEAQIKQLTNYVLWTDVNKLGDHMDKKYNRFIKQFRKKEKLDKDPFKVIFSRDGKFKNRDGKEESLEGSDAKVLDPVKGEMDIVVIDLRTMKPGTMPHEIFHILENHWAKRNEGDSKKWVENLSKNIHEAVRKTVLEKFQTRLAKEGKEGDWGNQYTTDKNGVEPVFYPRVAEGKPGHELSGLYNPKASARRKYDEASGKREKTPIELLVESKYRKIQDRKTFDSEYMANTIELMLDGEVGYDLFIKNNLAGKIKQDFNALREHLFAGTNFMGINLDALAPKLDLNNPMSIIEHMGRMAESWKSGTYNKKQADRFYNLHLKDMRISSDGKLIYQTQDFTDGKGIKTKKGGKSSVGITTEIIVNTRKEVITEQKEIALKLRQNLEDHKNGLITTEQYMERNAPLKARWENIEANIRAEKPVETQKEQDIREKQEMSNEIQEIYDNPKIDKQAKKAKILATKGIQKFITKMVNEKFYDQKDFKESAYKKSDFRRDLELVVLEYIYPSPGKIKELKEAYRPEEGKPLSQYLMFRIRDKIPGILEANVGKDARTVSGSDAPKMFEGKTVEGEFQEFGDLGVTSETTNTNTRLADILIKETISKDGIITPQTVVKNSTTKEIIDNFKKLKDQPKQNASTLDNLAPEGGSKLLGETKVYTEGAKKGKFDAKKTAESKIEGLIEMGPARVYKNGIREAAMLKTGISDIEGISSQVNDLLLSTFFKTGKRLSFKETGKGAGPKEQTKIEPPKGTKKIEVTLKDGRKIELNEADVWVLKKLGVDIVDGKINLSRIKTQVRKKGVDVNIKTLLEFEIELSKVLTNQTIREHVIDFTEKKSEITDNLDFMMKQAESLQRQTDVMSTGKKKQLAKDLQREQDKLDKLHEEFGLSEEFMSKEVVNTFISSVKSAMSKGMAAEGITVKELDLIGKRINSVVGPISIGHLHQIVSDIGLSKSHALVQELSKRIIRSSDKFRENIDFQIEEMLREQPEVEMKVLEAKNYQELVSKLDFSRLDPATKKLIKEYNSSESATGDKSIYKTEDAIKSRNKLQNEILTRLTKLGFDIGANKKGSYTGFASLVKRTFGFGSRSYKIWTGKEWVYSTNADAKIITDKAVKSTKRGDTSKNFVKVGKEKLSVKFILDNYKITDTGKFKTWQAEFIETYKGKNLETDLYHASRAELSRDNTSKGYEVTLKANEGLRKVYLNTLRDIIVDAKSGKKKADAIIEVMRHLRSQTNVGLGIVKGTATITSVSNRLGLEKFEGNKGSMFHAEHQLQLLNHTYMFMDMVLNSKTNAEFKSKLNLLSREFEQASTRYEDVKIYDSPLYGGKTGFIDYFKGRNLGTLSSIANIMYRPGISFEMVDLKSKIPGETIGEGLLSRYGKKDILDVIEFIKTKTPELYTGELAKLRVNAENIEANKQVRDNLNIKLDNALGGKSAKGLSVKDVLNTLETIDAAKKEGRKIGKESRGMSTWDFDDTLATTKSGVRAKIPSTDGLPKPGRKVIFLAGGAGSGKSNVVKKLGLEKDGFKIVNQDISLEWLKKNSGLPENMNDLTSAQRSTLGKLQHEARGIAKRKMMKYQGKADGVVIDGTGGSMKAMEKLVKEFKNKGYDVSMLFVETSLKTALSRNRARKERSLLDKIVEKNHAAVQGNKPGFKTIFGERFMEVKTDKLKQEDAMPSDLVNKMNDFVRSYEKIRLDAEEFASKGKSILDKGGEFDFAEFNVVTGGQRGPFFEKALARVKKYGKEHQFVLTARPPEAQVPIYEFLKSQGLEIPLENIKGLGNSTGEAKAKWMLEKFAEGYNDMYFADDALANVKAVKSVLEQLDIKSKVQLAGPQSKSARGIEDGFEKTIGEVKVKDMSEFLNEALEHKKGVEAFKTYSDARAKMLGSKKFWSRAIFGSPGAEDFAGLVTYAFAGKGKKGEMQKKFFEDNLQRPFNRAYNEIHAIKQAISNDYKALRKQMPEVRDILNEKIDDVYTVDHAVRVYLMNKAGHKITGLSKRDLKLLDDFVKNDADVLAFAEKLSSITRLKEVWSKPKDYWLGENITTELNGIVDNIHRKEFLSEFVENRKAMFGEWKNGRLVGKNMNKIEALYGSRHREAMENMIWRMEKGTNRASGTDSNTNRWMNWVNNATGTIMFFNQKSAMLQTISSLNYVNGSFNNPIRAAQAFANQPQFWKDFARIFNSDMLIQRRAGLKINLEAAELVERIGNGTGAFSKFRALLLEKGFMPTKYADSFAIASGGASFYRNSIRKYKKQGLSIKEAEARAWEDFTEMTEATQQSSRPDLISMQQASALGRPILAFANTPMQMFRRHKRRLQDVASNRGNMAENVGSALYYGFAQTALFSYFANAMFATDDESEDPKDIKHASKQKDRYVNTIVDSYLRGMGTGGASVSALKNGLFSFMKESEKDYNADYGNTVIEMLNVSPMIGSKARKVYSGLKTYKYNKEVIGEMGFDIDNPAVLATANFISAVTNIPTDRVVMKTNNIREAMMGDFENWQRVSMLLGYNKWVLGAEGGIAEAKIEAVEEKISTEKKLKRKMDKYNITEEEIPRLDKGIEIKKLNKNQQQFILYNILNSRIQTRRLKTEQERIDKILEVWDDNSKVVDSLLNTDISKDYDISRIR